MIFMSPKLKNKRSISESTENFEEIGQSEHKDENC